MHFTANLDVLFVAAFTQQRDEEVTKYTMQLAKVFENEHIDETFVFRLTKQVNGSFEVIREESTVSIFIAKRMIKEELKREDLKTRSEREMVYVYDTEAFNNHDEVGRVDMSDESIKVVLKRMPV